MLRIKEPHRITGHIYLGFALAHGLSFFMESDRLHLKLRHDVLYQLLVSGYQELLFRNFVHRSSNAPLPSAELAV